MQSILEVTLAYNKSIDTSWTRRRNGGSNNKPLSRELSGHDQRDIDIRVQHGIITNGQRLLVQVNSFDLAPNTSVCSQSDQPRYQKQHTNRSSQNNPGYLMPCRSSHPGEIQTFSVLPVLVAKGTRHNSEARDTVWQSPTASFVFAEAIETIPVQKTPAAVGVTLCAIETSIDVDPPIGIGPRIVPLVARVVRTLGVEDPGVVRLWVEFVNVFELPVDADLLAFGVISKVTSLVDEISRHVAGEEVGDIEAVAQDRDTICRERQSVGGVLVAA
jgi:hypothetical protein